MLARMREEGVLSSGNTKSDRQTGADSKFSQSEQFQLKDFRYFFILSAYKMQIREDLTCYLYSYPSFLSDGPIHIFVKNVPTEFPLISLIGPYLACVQKVTRGRVWL